MPDPTPPPKRSRAADDSRNLTSPESPPPPPPAPKPASPAAARIPLAVEVVLGDIVREPAPVAVVGRMERGAVTGVIGRFDTHLDDWLAHAVELGMIGSEVGELFHIPVPKGKGIAAGALLLAGMGEPGRFTEDDLRYLYGNVTFALTALGHSGFATVLIGENTGLPAGRVAADLAYGVAAALRRLPQPPAEGVQVKLVVHDENRWNLVRASLEQLDGARRGESDPLDRVALTVTARKQDGWAEAAADKAGAGGPTVAPQLPSARVTVLGAPAGRLRRDRLVLQYSALTEGSSIPVREVAVHQHIIDGLPGRLAEADDHDEQRRYGRLLAEYMVPEAFRRMLAEHDAVTLTLDAQTARFPWEMAVVSARSGPAALGTLVPVARQFRSDKAGVFGVPPPLNKTLRVLVVADPSSGAPGVRPLPGARREGLAVAEVLDKVQRAWGAQLELWVDLRLGSSADPDARGIEIALEQTRGYGCVKSRKPCDPIELMALLTNEEVDVIHFAGHGSLDVAKGLVGWVFARDHVWSAEEVFGLRRVPRLVFANACHSVEVDARARGRQVREQVGMAEAFFTRGVRNYVGTGWAVSDRQAEVMAREFYTRVLGLRSADDPTPRPYAPPAVVGVALAAARGVVRAERLGSTWGAYHHYGQWNDKLLPFTNVDAPAVVDKP